MEGIVGQQKHLQALQPAHLGRNVFQLVVAQVQILQLRALQPPKYSMSMRKLSAVYRFDNRLTEESKSERMDAISLCARERTIRPFALEICAGRSVSLL